MIRLRMMPGEDGDCLLLEYGNGDFQRRILVDGGRRGTYRRIKPVLAELDGPIDVYVVTHVDQDHILGVLALLDDPERPDFGDVWFNGFGHLQDVEDFGPKDGELLTTALTTQQIPWNKAFESRSIEVGRPLTWFDDGSTMEVLAPDRALLEALVDDWVAACKTHGLIPGVDPAEVPRRSSDFEEFGGIDVDALAEERFDRDDSLTNRSSIGLLFTFEGTRILLTGDADDPRLVKSIRPRAEAEGGKLRLDALKVSHHGSAHNTSSELLGLLDCDRYLISTNGSRHGHPDDIAIARILKHGGARKDLVFNYRKRAANWEVRSLEEEFGYKVLAPASDDEDGFITVEF